MHILKSLFFYTISLVLFSAVLQAQVVDLGCQTEAEATIGLDRKNWNNGSTTSHSEGYMFNFNLPANTFGQCKKIEQIDVIFDIINIDESGLPGDCPVGAYFTNVYTGCGSFMPASCPTSNLIDEINAVPTDQTITYTCPPDEFDFGDVFSVDLIPAMSDPGCSVGQSAISSGSLVLDFEVCVIVTVGDDMIEIPVDLGADQTICAATTSLLDAGSDYVFYDWSPNNENSQTINASGSPGGTTYEVMVTDANGCTDTDDIVITESMPIVSISDSDPDNTICAGESISLTAVTTESAILWSTNQNSTSILVGPGNYSVQVTDINNCTASASIQIDQYPINTVSLFPDMTIVCGSDQTNITASSGFIDYDWDNGDSGAMITVGAGTYTVVATDINGCESTETVQIVMETAPNAGDATNLIVCNDGTTFNVDANLGVHDFGGQWIDLDGAGVDMNVDPFNVSFAGVVPSIYQFSYTVFGSAPCADDIEIIEIEVVQGADAGSSNSLTICSDDPPVNFYNAVSTSDQSGFWTDVNGSGVDLSDPSAVDFSSIGNGTYVFNYEVIANTPCSNAISSLTVIVDAAANAGDANTVSICEGAEYNLFDALSVFADLGGTFSDDDNTSALTGSTFNTAGFAGQSVMFTYTLGSANCGVSSAVITVDVVSSVSAGDNTVGNVFCEGDVIDLFLVLQNEDAGGLFIDPLNTGALNANLFDSAISGTGTYTVNYEIGDNIICPLETSSIELIIVEAPTIMLQGDVELCPEECFELDIDLVGQGPLDFDLTAFEAPNVSSFIYTVSGENAGTTSVWICNGDQAEVSNDTIFMTPNPIPWMLIPNSISNAQCTNQVVNMDTVFVNTYSSYNVSITDDLCSDDSLEIGTMVFNAAMPSGLVMLSSVQGCDSIIDVNLNILDAGKLIVDNTLCTGESINIGGILFDEDNPSDTLIINDASASGCDSIIEVNLSFVESFNESDDVFICAGDSIMIDGVWVKDEGNYIDNLISVQQCDSIVDVSLMFYAPSEFLLNPTLCTGGMVIVNGTVYDADNPSGMETFDNASVNGCDSIVNIALDFSDEIIINLTREFCPGDSTQVGGIWYFENTFITESEVSSSGCDSTTNTTISVFPETVFNLNQELCNDGFIEVNGTIYDIDNPSGIETFENQDLNACDSTVLIALTFVTEITGMDQENICAGDSIFLEGAWQFDSGQYMDTFVSVNGCDSIVTTTLTVDDCFDLGTVEIIDNVCAGDANGSICVIINSGSIPLVVAWENTDNGEMGTIEISTLGNQFCESSLFSGNYILRYLDSTGAELASDNYTIQDLNAPLTGNIIVTNPLSCFGVNDAGLEVDVSGGAGNYTYSWNQNLGNGESVTNLGAGDYEVLVLDAEQCELFLDINLVAPQEMSFDVVSVNSTCADISNGSIRVSNINALTQDFTLSVNGNLLNAPYELSDLAAGSYTLVLTNTENCILENTIIIEDDASDILVDYTELYQIEILDSVQFVANYPASVDSVLWTPDNQGISCTTCLFPFFSPQSSSSYFLTLYDDSGCTEQIPITINVTIPEVNVFVPNVFSPNDDGLNDMFLIGFASIVTESYTLSIFDRWGNRMYEEDLDPNSQEGWDGKFNNVNVNPGVYMYQVRYIDPNRGEQYIGGSITVL